jgi:hypothetical protein
VGGGTPERRASVMLYFAYGLNMHRPVMRKHAPDAVSIGAGRLADYRFLITADGYASVEPARGRDVHGVIWRITPRDRITLDSWEGVEAGLYRVETLSVHGAQGVEDAFVYIARAAAEGTPKPHYMEVVIEAARAWNLPADYIGYLRTWLPAQGLTVSARNAEESGWM